MELMCEETKRIDDGNHIGQIICVELREKPYAYLDFTFELADTGHEGQKIKTGFPACLTPDSKLGKFLKSFGVEVVVGRAINPETAMLQKCASFLTYTETKQKGSYARIVQESIKWIPPKPHKITKVILGGN